MDKVTGQCPQTTTFLKRKESRSGIEQRGPSAYQPNALPLGQTGSRGGRPGLPVPNSPYGLCGRKATINVNLRTVGFDSVLA